MRLIALTGKAGAGKDTVAEHLWKGCQFEAAAFADPLRSMVTRFISCLYMDEELDWEDREWKERPLPLIGKSPRQLLQTLGTEWGRQLVHPDIWLIAAGRYLEAVIAAATDYYPPILGVIITDCRFENEAAWVRGRGGEVWHILRPQASPAAAHVSEAGVAVAPGDSIIDNSGTLDELHDQVRRALAGELKVERHRK